MNIQAGFEGPFEKVGLWAGFGILNSENPENPEKIFEKRNDLFLVFLEFCVIFV